MPQAVFGEPYRLNVGLGGIASQMSSLQMMRGFDECTDEFA
jgi:hypothetical protein